MSTERAAGGDRRTVRVGTRDVPLIRFAAPPAEAVMARALRAAGLPVGRRPVVVLAGGAAGLAADDPLRWRRLFEDGLVAGLVRAGGCLVDGGTDVGVMGLAGAARTASGADYPAVAVVVEGTVRWPGRVPPGPGAAEIGAEHTHVVAVPGREWGLDPPWMSLVAGALAGPARSLTVVVNGGPISAEDARLSVAAGRPVLAVAGTGRLADALAAATRDLGTAGGVEAAIVRSGLVDVVDGLRHPHRLADAIAALAG